VGGGLCGRMVVVGVIISGSIGIVLVNIGIIVSAGGKRQISMNTGWLVAPRGSIWLGGGHGLTGVGV